MTECRTVTRLARGSTTWSTAPPPSSPWSSSGRPWMGGGPTPTSSSRPRTPASPRGPPTPRPRCPQSPPPCSRASTPSSTMTPCPYLTTTTTNPTSATSSRTLLTPQVTPTPPPPQYLLQSLRPATAPCPSMSPCRSYLRLRPVRRLLRQLMSRRC